jgi:hypothetical protein
VTHSLSLRFKVKENLKVIDWAYLLLPVEKALHVSCIAPFSSHRRLGQTAALTSLGASYKDARLQFSNKRETPAQPL